ncbi:hypothetical protein OO256_14125 [Pseudomonas sp. DCB_CB]|uniref:Uncharacterized protein n=1 Tax=Pseudomonas putida (strain DOT-T1E) TaxID=1196325 RepID=I7C293_PSEPT|nr:MULTISPECIES: hypothetical protein [Pseudomonas]AFO47191.1 hypothetical protein T1E_1336 [Pseudomonas putida DOT-T1E]MCX2691888.1 hypothetical protein [Pseudomonas sp. DCB_BZ]MCX2857229.1 hypothetical protein [Pseudomonas sp. DCB_CB]UZM95150.1 hypothetical protein OPZ46_06940 [Pseudomonas putida DOT-T1E]
MGALRAAQWRYDHAEPEDDSAHQEAAQNWIESKAEELVGGCDVLIPQRFGGPVGVRQDQFVVKVAEHLRALQEAEKDDLNALALLLLQAQAGGPVKSMVEDVVGQSDHCRGKLYEIAESMLDQYAEQGLRYEADEARL